MEVGYNEQVKDEMLGDTLVFELESDKVQGDAIRLGNTLTARSSEK